jgi:hypothetical protein
MWLIGICCFKKDQKLTKGLSSFQIGLVFIAIPAIIPLYWIGKIFSLIIEKIGRLVK